MTLTPLSPLEGTLTAWEPKVAEHVLGGDEAVFIHTMLELRKQFLAGKETQNDHQLVAAWLSQCSPTGSDETVKTYVRHIEKFRLFLRRWNELSLLEQRDERLLAPGDSVAIEAFAGSLREMTQTLGGTGKPVLSISTYNATIAAISSFYKWASQPNRRANTGVPLSPVPSKLQLKKLERKAKALSQDQLHQVYFGARQCATSPSRSRDELIIRLLYLLGTRATETANLRWDDVVPLESGPAVHIRRGKGGKERFIPIDRVVVELLNQLKTIQPDSQWLLPNLRQPDRHISRQGLWKLCKRAGEEVGVKTWTHQLRHSHATHAWAATKDAKLIQQTLGHADISTTMNLYVDESNGDSSTKHLTGG